MSGRAVFFWFFVSAIAPGFVTAQEAVNYASVSGRVTDATGAALPTADVAARHLDTNVRTTATR